MKWGWLTHSSVKSSNLPISEWCSREVQSSILALTTQVTKALAATTTCQRSFNDFWQRACPSRRKSIHIVCLLQESWRSWSWVRRSRASWSAYLGLKLMIKSLHSLSTWAIQILKRRKRWKRQATTLTPLWISYRAMKVPVTSMMIKI